MMEHRQVMTQSVLVQVSVAAHPTQRTMPMVKAQNPDDQHQFLANVYVLILSNRALMATITVLADISTAPIAGVSSTPHAYSAPAASGMAKVLYPVAQSRF